MAKSLAEKYATPAYYSVGGVQYLRHGNDSHWTFDLRQRRSRVVDNVPPYFSPLRSIMRKTEKRSRLALTALTFVGVFIVHPLWGALSLVRAIFNVCCKSNRVVDRRSIWENCRRCRHGLNYRASRRVVGIIFVGDRGSARQHRQSCSVSDNGRNTADARGDVVRLEDQVALHRSSIPQIVDCARVAIVSRDPVRSWTPSGFGRRPPRGRLRVEPLQILSSQENCLYSIPAVYTFTAPDMTMFPLCILGVVALPILIKRYRQGNKGSGIIALGILIAPLIALHRRGLFIFKGDARSRIFGAR